MSSSFLEKFSLFLFPIHFWIALRWIMLSIQFASTLWIWRAGELAYPVEPIFFILLTSFFANGFLTFSQRSIRLSLPQAPYYLIYDFAQITAFLYVTGGLSNPLCFLFLGPVCMMAALLSGRELYAIGALSLAAIAFLWKYAPSSLVSPFWKGAIASSLCVTVLFVSFCLYVLSMTARHLHDTLMLLQKKLDRDHHMTSLGALAAAAAHELGSPLTTITIVAKDLLSDLKNRKKKEIETDLEADIEVISHETDRCRDILTRLSHGYFSEEPIVGQVSFPALLEIAASSYQKPSITLRVDSQIAADLRVTPSPDLLYGLGHILQNAYEYAHSTVYVLMTQTREKGVSMLIRDDGPGYPKELLNYLTESTVLSFPFAPSHAERSEKKEADSKIHLGLGLFISQMLLTSKGIQLYFYNDEGACCLLTWKSTLYSEAV